MSRLLRLIALAGVTMIAGCAVGPDYRRPAFETTASYKESADWKPTEPGDAMDRGPWWNVFRDEDLSRLTEYGRGRRRSGR